MLWVWGGAAVAVVVILVALLFTLGGGPAKKVSSDGLVTTFLPGEFRTVPDVCTAVTSATLGQYLPGKLHMVAPTPWTAAPRACATGPWTRRRCTGCSR